MLKQERYTPDEYSEMFMFFMKNDNLSASAELRDHEKFFGKIVKVMRGRKVPHGTQGVVVYFKSTHYGGQWFEWHTRIGIKDKDGNVFYTALNNVELCAAQPEGDYEE